MKKDAIIKLLKAEASEIYRLYEEELTLIHRMDKFPLGLIINPQEFYNEQERRFGKREAYLTAGLRLHELIEKIERG